MNMIAVGALTHQILKTISLFSKMEFEKERRMFSMLLLMHLTIDGTKYAVKA